MTRQLRVLCAQCLAEYVCSGYNLVRTDNLCQYACLKCDHFDAYEYILEEIECEKGSGVAFNGHLTEQLT